MTSFNEFLPIDYCTLDVLSKDALFNEMFTQFSREYMKNGENDAEVRKIAKVQYTTLYAHNFMYKKNSFKIHY